MHFSASVSQHRDPTHSCFSQLCQHHHSLQSWSQQQCLTTRISGINANLHVVIQVPSVLSELGTKPVSYGHHHLWNITQCLLSFRTAQQCQHRLLFCAIVAAGLKDMPMYCCKSFLLVTTSTVACISRLLCTAAMEMDTFVIRSEHSHRSDLLW